MATLGVNIDHIATLRQARGGKEPDPVHAAMFAELAGAHGITAHLREDRRHIQDRDIHLLKQVAATHLNLEMAGTQEMVKIAQDLQPYMVTLVPEKREEKTTEGGCAVREHEKEFSSLVGSLLQNNILVSMFIAPDFRQIKSSKRIGATHVELHTGYYANTVTESARSEELEKLVLMAEAAAKFGLHVNAGHGLDYSNVRPVAMIPHIEELNIGHAIVSRAALIGMTAAVKEMLALIS
ncbi:MAG: pyridoxine 5'-phosphate synthase [Chitinispirillaceae bacterium]|nr:pyridoxine 5'-phosphate synthase [Chitinispirillaceae bacterium]